MRFESQTFENQTIVLDWNEFINCKLVNCVVRYAGHGPVDFRGSSLDKCTIELFDAAARTLGFISDFGKRKGSDGRMLIDSLFDLLRSDEEDGSDGQDDQE